MTCHIMYCIMHEKEVAVEEPYYSPQLPLAHLEITGMPFEADFNWCEGPFTYCPPPDEDTDQYYDWLFSNEESIQDLLDYYAKMED